MSRRMRLPTVVLNFKTYPEVLGKRGWDLAKACDRVAQDTGASIVVAPPTSDLAHLAKLVRLPVLGQHVDAVEPGQTTGWGPPRALLEAGAARRLSTPTARASRGRRQAGSHPSPSWRPAPPAH